MRLSRFLWSLSLIVLFTVIFFYDWAFTDRILGRGDAFNYFYPYWDVRNGAFRAGQLPLWSPDIFGGVPLLANPQLGTFYPLNWLFTFLRAPEAIRYSVLIHIFLASLGVYVLFYRLSQARGGFSGHALIAALVYGFGGHLGAHVEQINQLQGLALLPWCFWLYDKSIAKVNWRQKVLYTILLSMIWAMQIFAGHTQTVFITGIALGVYCFLASARYRSIDWRSIGMNLAMLGVAACVALLLAIPQLIPTLELSALSNRSSGLGGQGATAFSLPPTYIGRALLPNYDGQLFGEYVAYVGVVGLGLALVGLFATANRLSIIWGAIALVGLFLALGRFNPLYAFLVELPGFNLFRVPARWLALYSLAMAILAGCGSKTLTRNLPLNNRLIAGIASFIVLCMALTSILPMLAPQLAVQAEDIIGSAIPTQMTLLGWAIAFVGFISLLWLPRIAQIRRWMTILVILAISLELFVVGLIQPYHDLVPPTTYLGQRFTVSQLLAYQESGDRVGRVLAISGLLFDTGDKASLEALYKSLAMDELAVRNALVAIKRQETLFPNLSLTWGIPSIDGFDGGLLPTQWYSHFSSLITGGKPTIDGRLGEILAQDICRGLCLPPSNILDLMGIQYLIADKVYDVWHNDVAYDTTFATLHSAIDWYAHPSFVADEAHLLLSEDHAPLISVDGERWLKHNAIDSTQSGFVARYLFDTPQTVNRLTLRDDTSIVAVTIVDSRTGDFQQMTPLGWKKVFSSDIKLYERDLWGRAYLVQDVRFVDDEQAAYEALRRDEIVLHGSLHDLPLNDAFQGIAHIIEDSPTRVEIQTQTNAPAYLILSDAYYAGWSATVNDQPTPVLRANLMFRAVFVPEGESHVIFTFQPNSWYIAIGVGVFLWIVAIALTLYLARLSYRNS